VVLKRENEEKCCFGTVGCRYNNDHECEQKVDFRKRMDSRDRATEERLAWDRYAAATMARDLRGDTFETDARISAEAADALLEERRKRFGAGK
jgi:hypothetical protein